MASSSPDRVDVVVDPAHGGVRPLGGATPGLRAGVRTGQLEKHVVLGVALAMEQALGSRGRRVALTRESDREVPLRDRVAMASELGARVFVSLHADGARGRPGPSVFVHRDASSRSRDLARAAFGGVASVRGMGAGVVRGLGPELAPSSFPSRTAACLVDLGCLADASDDALLADPNHQARLGWALGRAVADWLDAGERPAVVGRADPAWDVWHQVPLVPQTTGMSCWAAAAAMVIGWRDAALVEPEAVARGAGRWQEYRDGLLPECVDDLARVWGLSPVREPLEAASLRRWLAEWGPAWIGEASPGLHSVVLVGMEGDGTLDGTRVRVNDPWPEGIGERYVLSLRDLLRQVGAAATIVGAGPQILTAGGRRAQARSTPTPAPAPPQVGRPTYGAPVALIEAYRDRPPPPVEPAAPRPALPAARTALTEVRGSAGSGTGTWVAEDALFTATALGAPFEVRVGERWVRPSACEEQGSLSRLTLSGGPSTTSLRTGPPNATGTLRILTWDGGEESRVVRARFTDALTFREGGPDRDRLGAAVLDERDGEPVLVAVLVPDAVGAGLVGQRLPLTGSSASPGPRSP